MTASHLTAGTELDPVHGPGPPADGLFDLLFGDQLAAAEHFPELGIFPDDGVPFRPAEWLSDPPDPGFLLRWGRAWYCRPPWE